MACLYIGLPCWFSINRLYNYTKPMLVPSVLHIPYFILKRKYANRFTLICNDHISIWPGIIMPNNPAIKEIPWLHWVALIYEATFHFTYWRLTDEYFANPLQKKTNLTVSFSAHGIGKIHDPQQIMQPVGIHSVHIYIKRKSHKRITLWRKVAWNNERIISYKQKRTYGNIGL